MRERYAFNLHADSITALSISENGQFIASAAYDGTVHITNIENNAVVSFNAHHYSMADDNYAPEPHDHPIVLVDFLPQAGRFLTVGDDGQVAIRTYPAGELIQTHSLRPGPYRAFAVSPDGKLLAGGAEASGKEVAAEASGADAGEPDKNLRLWSLDTGKEIWAAVHGHTEEKIPYDWGEVDCECSVQAVAFSPDGRFLASVGDDRMVRLWHADSHGLSQSFPVAHPAPPECIAFSPDGAFIAVGGGESQAPVDVFKIEDGSLSWFSGNDGPDPPVIGPANAVSFSPDGSVIASAHPYDAVRLWEAKKGAPRLSHSAHAIGPTALAFSADGKTLATGGWNGVVTIWDLEN